MEEKFLEVVDQDPARALNHALGKSGGPRRST